jgi:hypothetical protein
MLLVFPVHGIQINAGDGTFLISNGDDAIITGSTNDTSKSGYLWLYTGNYATLIYGEPIEMNNGTYIIRINKSVSLSPGKYRLFMQFSGDNNIQEVLFDKEMNRLFSPWRYPKPIDVSSNIAAVPGQISQYCTDNKKYCDDTFMNSTLIVESSFIKLSEQYQTQNDEKDITKNGMLYVGGTTNLGTSTTINVTLDYVQTVTAKITSKNAYGYNVWSAYLNISRLRPGDHTILIQSSKTADLKNILSISEYIPTPKPTPTPVRYVKNEMKEFIVVPNAPVVKVTVTPMIVNSSNKKFVPVETPEIIRTQQAAPPGSILMKPTETNKINYVKVEATPTAKSPVDIIAILSSILLAIWIVTRKG